MIADGVEALQTPGVVACEEFEKGGFPGPQGALPGGHFRPALFVIGL